MSQAAIIGVVVLMMMSSSAGAAMLMMGGDDDKKTTGPSSPGPAPPVVDKYRYVRIYRDQDTTDANHWMNIAEVEVFSGGVNVASGKTVTASSLYGAGFPHANLVDGNMTNFAHTNNEAVEWFLIDLGQDYEIEKVVITNRTDCCQARLRNTKIQLSKSSDMTSPKESRVVTTAEAPNAKVTWTVKTNTFVAA
jgi:hypothetical protein